MRLQINDQAITYEVDFAANSVRFLSREIGLWDIPIGLGRVQNMVKTIRNVLQLNEENFFIDFEMPDPRVSFRENLIIHLVEGEDDDTIARYADPANLDELMQYCYNYYNHHLTMTIEDLQSRMK